MTGQEAAEQDDAARIREMAEEAIEKWRSLGYLKPDPETKKEETWHDRPSLL